MTECPNSRLLRSLRTPLLAIIAALAASPAVYAAGELDGNASLYAPYVEWSFDNPSFSGNPFDLMATVTFVHSSSSETHTTEMFYDGGTSWKVRFTGTQVGSWSASSSSSDGDLDGFTGTITVSPSTVSFGFVGQHTIAEGTKWTRQTAGGEEAFVPQFVMFHLGPNDYENDPIGIDAAVAEFIGPASNHFFNGFHTTGAGWWFDIDGDHQVEGSNSDPNLRTFEAMEDLIVRTHAAGGVVHIWKWWDSQIGGSSDQLAGGTNGAEEQRLSRYIAARLGPLPGWTMGYGYDLDEWVTESELNAWRDYLQARIGWFHYLGGRAAGPNSGTSHSPYIDWNDDLDYSSYEHHEPSPDVYEAAISAITDQPVFSEDRFRIIGFGGPGQHYTMEQTRRGLWDSTMAGGVANIWGNLTTPEGGTVPHGLSLPYPEPDWIRTYSEFFFTGNRFFLELVRANELTDGVALQAPGMDYQIFYITDSDSIQIDLSGSSGPQSAVAVDTTAVYAEIDLGTLPASNQTLTLPGFSDWAIVVGQPPSQHSVIFEDGFETGDTSRWSNSVPGATAVAQAGWHS